MSVTKLRANTTITVKITVQALFYARDVLKGLNHRDVVARAFKLKGFTVIDWKKLRYEYPSDGSNIAAIVTGDTKTSLIRTGRPDGSSQA